MAAGRQLDSLGRLKHLRQRFEALAKSLESCAVREERKELLKSMKVVFDGIDELIAYERACSDSTEEDAPSVSP